MDNWDISREELKEKEGVNLKEEGCCHLSHQEVLTDEQKDHVLKNLETIQCFEIVLVQKQT